MKSIMDQFLKKHLFPRRLDDNKIKKLRGDLFTPLVKLGTCNSGSSLLKRSTLTSKDINFCFKFFHASD